MAGAVERAGLQALLKVRLASRMAAAHRIAARGRRRTGLALAVGRLLRLRAVGGQRHKSCDRKQMRQVFLRARPAIFAARLRLGNDRSMIVAVENSVWAILYLTYQIGVRNHVRN